MPDHSCSSDVINSTLVHLDESDIIEESNHFDEDWGLGLGVLEMGLADVPFASKTPLLQSSEAQVIHFDTRGCECYYETSQFACTRPEFLFARITKPAKGQSIGVFLINRKGGLYISRINPNGLFGRSNLRAGDRVLSINGVSCLKRGANRAAKLIRNSGTTVSITVHNKGGNPNLVSSSVQKLSPREMVGIGFRKRRGALYITRVDEKGLLGGSLTLPGHRCVMINGSQSPNTPSRDAAKLVQEAREFVTIVSKPDESSAVVLSCENQKMWKSVACIGLLAGAVGAAGHMVTNF